MDEQSRKDRELYEIMKEVARDGKPGSKLAATYAEQMRKGEVIQVPDEPEEKESGWLAKLGFGKKKR